MSRVTRRRFLNRALSLSSLILLAACGLPRLPWQPATRVPLVGFISASPLAPESVYAAFLLGLRDLGYVEGQSIVVEYRDVEGKPELIGEFVSELLQRQVDVIVVAPTTPIPGIRQISATVPIVVAYGDPVAAGLVNSLSRPGGATTGLTAASAALSGKRLQLLREILPSISRVGFIAGRVGASNQFVRETEEAAESLGLQLQVLRLEEPSEFRAAFEAMRAAGAEAVVVAPGPLFSTGRGALVTSIAAEFGLPLIVETRLSAYAGGLLAYGPNLVDLARRAATYVDKILKGASPADLPIEQPTAFDFVVNLKTAEALGITVPASVLAQATEIIQ